MTEKDIMEIVNDPLLEELSDEFSKEQLQKLGGEDISTYKMNNDAADLTDDLGSEKNDSETESIPLEEETMTISEQDKIEIARQETIQLHVERQQLRRDAKDINIEIAKANENIQTIANPDDKALAEENLQNLINQKDKIQKDIDDHAKQINEKEQYIKKGQEALRQKEANNRKEKLDATIDKLTDIKETFTKNIAEKEEELVDIKCAALVSIKEHLHTANNYFVEKGATAYFNIGEKARSAERASTIRSMSRELNHYKDVKSMYDQAVQSITFKQEKKTQFKQVTLDLKKLFTINPQKRAELEKTELTEVPISKHDQDLIDRLKKDMQQSTQKIIDSENHLIASMQESLQKNKELTQYLEQKMPGIHTQEREGVSQDLTDRINEATTRIENENQKMSDIQNLEPFKRDTDRGER